MNHVSAICVSAAIGLFFLASTGCASADRPRDMTEQTTSTTSEARASEPPAQIRAWMDRLTVEHEYDPSTGFIVAREVIELPGILAASPPLEKAVQLSRAEGSPLVVFATADRCGPCQQFKKDALNDVRVVDRLEQADLLAAHVEVDREPEAARRYLGGTGIPMTYLLRDGEVVASLPGQRDGPTLARWLDEQLHASPGAHGAFSTDR